MGNENLKLGRKAAIDFANFLSKEKIPPLHIIERTFQLRYGFGISKIKVLMRGYKDEFKLDEENDRIVKVK